MKYTDYIKYLGDLKEKSLTELKNNKKQYYKKLFLFGLLGYLFIYGITLLFIAIFGFFLYLAFISHHGLILLLKAKFLFLLLIPAYVIIKTLFIKIPEPAGYEIKKQDYKEFFEKLEKAQKELGIKIHKVIINEESSAFVAMIPRLGILGWNKNILGIGLPFILGLSEEELRAVLYHEFGHISSKHGKFGLWIYKTKIRFGEFLEAFKQQQFLGGELILKFFDWYYPRFSVYSFSLMREQEFEADQNSVINTSKEDFKKSLINTYFIDKLFSKYNESIFSKILENKTPSKNFYRGAYDFIKNYEFTSKDIEEVKQIIKKNENNFFNTHPSVEERLKIHNLNFEFKGLSKQKAIETIFDEKLIKEFDKKWYENIKDYWEHQYNEKKELLKRLEELEKKGIDNLSIDELKEAFLLSYDNPEFKIDSFKYIEKAYSIEKPLEDTTIFNYGASLLDKKDEKGVFELERVLENKDLFESAFALIIDFYEKRGDKINAKKWTSKMENYFDKDYFSEEERKSFSRKDEIEELNQDDLENLKIMKEYISNNEMGKKIKSIFVVKKKLKHFNSKPLYVFLIKLNTFTLNTTIEDIIGFLAYDMISNTKTKIDYEILLYGDDGSYFNFDFKKIKKNGVNLLEL